MPLRAPTGPLCTLWPAPTVAGQGPQHGHPNTIGQGGGCQEMGISLSHCPAAHTCSILPFQGPVPGVDTPRSHTVQFRRERPRHRLRNGDTGPGGSGSPMGISSVLHHRLLGAALQSLAVERLSHCSQRLRSAPVPPPPRPAHGPHVHRTTSFRGRSPPHPMCGVVPRRHALDTSELGSLLWQQSRPLPAKAAVHTATGC